MGKKRKKRKFNIVKFLIVVFIIYIIGFILYKVLLMPIKHIRVLNTTYLKDQDILNTAKIDDYPSFFLLLLPQLKNLYLKIRLSRMLKSKRNGFVNFIFILKKIRFYFITVH